MVNLESEFITDEEKLLHYFPEISLSQNTKNKNLDDSLLNRLENYKI